MTATAMEIRKLVLQATRAMQSRDYSDAIGKLRSAVRSVVPDFHSVLADHSESESVELLEIKFVPLRETFDSNQSFYAHYNGYYVYANAISFPVTEMDETKSLSDSDLTLISAILLFDLGLAFHLRGLQVATKCQEHYLNNSLRIYDMALAVLENCESVPRTIDVPTNFLRMALYNNMGHIYLILLNEENELWCIHRLEMIISIDEACDELLLEEISQFQLNVLVQEDKNHHVCAPAA